MKDQPEFYMAGIYNPWTDQDTKITTNIFAIVTTEANTLMKQIHNSKERMPTILPGDLAESFHSPLFSPLFQVPLRESFLILRKNKIHAATFSQRSGREKTLTRSL